MLFSSNFVLILSIEVLLRSGGVVAVSGLGIGWRASLV